MPCLGAPFRRRRCERGRAVQARRVLLVAGMSPYRRAAPVAVRPKDPGVAGLWILLLMFIFVVAIALDDAPASAPLLRAVRAVFGH
jgi:hypothetical protein